MNSPGVSQGGASAPGLGRKFHTPFVLAVGAKSDYAAVEAYGTNNPAEASLLPSIQCMRGVRDYGRLRKLWWVATRGMASDGTNKGNADRHAVIGVLQHNVWKQSGGYLLLHYCDRTVRDPWRLALRRGAYR